MSSGYRGNSANALTSSAVSGMRTLADIQPEDSELKDVAPKKQQESLGRP